LGLSGVAEAAPKDDARRYFIAGLQAAQAQEYQAALDSFLRAQAAYPHPATLYNIARAYTDLGDLEQAISYYELFAVADPEEAEDVAPVIDVLRARLQQDEGTITAGAPAAGGSLNSQEIQRLMQIAQELEQLNAQLQRRSTAPAVEQTVSDSSTPTPVVVDDSGEYISTAYEEYIVSASRYGQSALDSPSTISVITAREIRMSGASTLPDLLRSAVGVEVMSLASSQLDVSIRGFNREISNKVLVLVDGRSIYWDILSTPLWSTLPVSLEEIERIEITRGPGSALYGANAVNGVINIITRLPGEGDNIVHVDVGQPGYGRGTALLTGRKDQTSYRFATGFERMGRWSTAADPDLNSSVQLSADDDNLSLNTIRASGRIDRTFLDKGLLSTSGSYIAGDSEFYTLGALGDYALRDFRATYARLDLGWEPLLFRVFYNSLDAYAGTWYGYSEPKRLPTILNSDIIDSELFGIFEFQTGAVEHKISAGLGYRYKEIDWDYLESAPIVENHFSGFAQEDARIGAVSLFGALRVDRHPLVDISETISPRGAVVWRVRDQESGPRFQKTSLRGTFGTSFRSPSFTESYISLEQPNANEPDALYVTTLGNRDLVPERIMTAELGVRDESALHNADAVVYFNRVTELISLDDLESTVAAYSEESNGFMLGTSSFINDDAVFDGVGVELDGRLFPVDGLDLRGNLHWQQITSTADGESIEDQSASSLKVNFNVSYSTQYRFDIAAGVHYLSPQTWRLRDFDESGAVTIIPESIDARTIPTARIAARPLADGSLEISGTVWNPLGFSESGRFREHPKGQLVTSRLYGSLTYRF
jgi:iron complex outermembrane receptor protein